MDWQFPYYTIGEPLNWEELTNVFDWIRDMQGVEQDPEWHAEGDVFTHTKMVISELVALAEFETLTNQEKQILVVSALLHDVEKRSTTAKELIDGKLRITSPKHAKLGEFTARRILYKDIKTPFRIREEICKLVRLHGLPLWAIEKEDPKKAVIYASQVVNTKLLSLLAKADVLGRICKDQADLLFKIECFEELCKESKCYGAPKTFKSNYGRYLYFTKQESYSEYEPFDDLKFKVEVLSGLPGSGKDTYIKDHFDLPVLSLDSIRRALKIDPTDKKKNGQVIQIAKEEAKKMMRARTPFIFNATNITSDMRSKWINLFASYGGEVTINYIEVPYKELLKQNHNREYKVPEHVIDKLLSKLEIPTVKEAHNIKYIIKS